MLEYAMLNLVFCAVVFAVIFMFPVKLHLKAMVITIVSLLILTLVFNQFIIGFGMVAYNQEILNSLRIINIPPPDFAYALLAAIFVPYLWQKFSKPTIKLK